MRTAKRETYVPSQPEESPLSISSASEYMGQKYKVSPEEFGEILAELDKSFKALVKLNTAHGAAGKNATLTFQDKENPEVSNSLTAKQLRDRNAQFGKELRDLKNYFRVSMKKTKKKSDPAKYEGTYVPIVGRGPLLDFFNLGREKFGLIDPNDPKSGYLMDSLPLVRKGYLLRNGAPLLLNIYSRQNNLQDSKDGRCTSADKDMDLVFGKKRAVFFLAPGEKNKSKGGKVLVKVLMTDAEEKGQVRKGGISTFENLSINFTDENSGFHIGEKFGTYFFQNMCSANYFSKDYIMTKVYNMSAKQNTYEAHYKDKEFIQDERNLAQMLKEHNIIRNTSSIWREILKQEKARQGPNPVPNKRGCRTLPAK